jgi:hypothetical protein
MRWPVISVQGPAHGLKSAEEEEEDDGDDEEFTQRCTLSAHIGVYVSDSKEKSYRRGVC